MCLNIRYIRITTGEINSESEGGFSEFIVLRLWQYKIGEFVCMNIVQKFLKLLCCPPQLWILVAPVMLSFKLHIIRHLVLELTVNPFTIDPGKALHFAILV